MKLMAAIGMLLTVLLIVATSVGAQQPADSASMNEDRKLIKCDTPFRGRYVNSSQAIHSLPTGYGGQWQSPCAYDEKLRDCICIGNHGLYLALTNTSSINVFSGYPVELDEERPAQAKILGSMVGTQREAAKELGATSFRVESV